MKGVDRDLFERLSSRIDMVGIKRSVTVMDTGGGIPPLGAGGDMVKNGNEGEG